MAGASPLTTEQGQYIDAQIAKKGRQRLMGRQLMNVSGPYGFGVESFGFDVLTELSAGKIDLVWGKFEEDIAGLARTTIPIPVLNKGFRIGARQLAASKLVGAPLDSTTIDAAIYQVCLKEDDLIVMGKTDDSGTSYTINGLYKGAGNTEATSKDFGTEAYVYAKLALAEAVLQTDSIYPPYNLVLANTQYNELLALATGGIRTIKSVVEERIGGKVFRAPDLTVDTGMLIATAEQDFFDLVIGVDMTHREWLLPKSDDVFGVVYECAVPRIKDSNAICTLTAI